MNDKSHIECNNFEIFFINLNKINVYLIIRVPSPPYTLIGNVDSRAKMYRERLILTQQRLLRSGNFYYRGLNKNHNSSDKIEISTIDSLLGTHGPKFLLGYLTQVFHFNHYIF